MGKHLSHYELMQDEADQITTNDRPPPPIPLERLEALDSARKAAVSRDFNAAKIEYELNRREHLSRKLLLACEAYELKRQIEAYASATNAESSSAQIACALSIQTDKLLGMAIRARLFCIVGLALTCFFFGLFLTWNPTLRLLLFVPGGVASGAGLWLACREVKHFKHASRRMDLCCTMLGLKAA